MTETEGLTVGSLPDPLEDWWSDYARSLRRRKKSDKTARRYRKSFVRFWRWAISDEGPDDLKADVELVTRDHINDWTDYLRDQDIKPVTVTTYWTNLRPFFSWLAKEIDLVNPFDRADYPTMEEDPVPVREVDEVRALLATCSTKGFNDRRDEAIIRELYDTGVRLDELTTQALDSWDRRSDFMTVTGKTGTRTVPASPTTGEAIARYLRLRAKHALAEKTDAMWLGRKGPLTGSGIEQMLARRSKLAGIQRVSPQQLRHTFSHEFRDQGGSEGDLMYLGGWSSLAMPARYGRSAAAARARRAHQRIRLGDQL